MSRRHDLPDPRRPNNYNDYETAKIFTDPYLDDELFSDKYCSVNACTVFVLFVRIAVAAFVRARWRPLSMPL